MKRRIGIRSIAIFLILAALPLQAGCFPAAEANGGLVISEVVTSNGSSLMDSKYGSPDWIELYNGSGRDINLSCYQITKRPNKPGSAALLPDVVIKAGGYLILYANKSKDAYERGGAICLGFSLSRDGETLVLADERDNIIQTLDVPALGRDVSWARRADGSYGYCFAPTPGAANADEIFDDPTEVGRGLAPAVTGGVILINEIVSKNIDSLPVTCCDGGDWVELRNTSGEEVSLSGYTLCNSPAKADANNLRGVTIPANGYVVVRCCKDGCDDSDGHICVRMGIKRAGAEVFLYDASGQLADMVRTPSLPPDMSWARRENGSFGYCGQPTPGAANTTAISDSTEPTPMGEDAPVRISEVLPDNKYDLADADGDRSAWVELVCKSPDTAPNGYYLSNDISNPRKWKVPADAFNALGYAVIFLSGKDRVGDEPHANFKISVGKTLFLFDANTNSMDAVAIPDVRANVSLGPGGVYYTYPTPGGKNAPSSPLAEGIGYFHKNGVFISEVSAVHEKGKRLTDWVEIHNGGRESVDLNGYYLSNDRNDLQKWQIGKLSIKSGGYAVIEASRHITRQKADTATFGISAAGTTLYLVSPEGWVVDAFETGVLRLGLTSGRVVDNDKIARVFFSQPTKGAANASGYSAGYCSQPIFSETGLYQSGSFALTLRSSTQGAAIYYTTDGSEPTTNSEKYSKPIQISKTAVIRAISVASGLLHSEIATYHFLFEAPHTVPVLCIAMNPQKFTEVYQVRDHSKKVERDGFLSWYEKDGSLGAAFPAGLKAKGRGTLGYAQKSLSINLRASYGQRTVNYPFFPGYAFTEFSNLCIRNGGQDFGKARMADPYASRAAQGLHVEAAMTRPVVVYINGKYWGIYDFGEKLNDGYLQTHYGVDKDDVEVIFRNTTPMKGKADEMIRVRSFADKHHMSNQARFEEYCQWVDVPYFTDYYIARTYFCETDMGFNQKYWRTTDYTIKWRPILFDNDYSMRNAVHANMIGRYFSTGITSANGTPTSMNLFIALYQNEGWRDYCVERYVWAICVHFAPERMAEIFDEMVAELEPEMARHIARWNNPKSVGSWKSFAGEIRNYSQNRPRHALAHVKKFFNVSDARMDELIAKYSAPGAVAPEWRGP
ncbi:MAG: lamin tail domain-containing protein [Clostridiales bacterium]|nr:lamin tail domain-containing protein [Clostridiales bacterium]